VAPSHGTLTAATPFFADRRTMMMMLLLMMRPAVEKEY
jgi:hypothetical protein